MRPKPGPVQELPPTRLNQVFLFKLGAGLMVTMLVASFSVALLIRPTVEVVGEGPSATRAYVELTEILERLQGTWDPEARQRILDEARGHDERFVGALRRVLRQWNHPLRLEAIEYAGAFGAEGLRSDVANLATRGRADFRAAAVRATERLGSWANEDLADFLATGIVPVQVAVLEIVAERQDGPWQRTIEQLKSRDPEVRQAALAAVPRQPTAKATQVLWELIEAGPADVTALGLEALAKTDRVRDFELDVSSLLSRGEPQVQVAALELLAEKAAPLVRAKAVQQLAWDFSGEFEVRAAAFRCLERTTSYNADELRSGAFALEPRLQYLAARCLISAGEKRGLVLLPDLIQSDQEEVVLASRVLLGRLTGSSPQSTVDDFRTRIDAGVECAGPLPAPSVSF